MGKARGTFGGFVLRDLIPALVLGALLMLVAAKDEIFAQAYDLWSSHVIAPKVEAAQAEARQGHVDQAIGAVQELLREHPDNPQLLVTMAAFHFDADRPATGLFYAIAYLRSARTKDPRLAEVLARLLLSDPDIPRYLATDNYADPGIIARLVDQLPISVDTKAALHFRFDEQDVATRHSLAKELKVDERLFHALPRGWRVLTEAPPQDVLAASDNAWSGARAAGLIDITPPTLAKGTTYGHRWPRVFFVRTNLWNAVRQGAIDAPAKEAGPDCCRLSLQDPALLPVDRLVEAFIAGSGGRNPAESSAAGAARFLDVRERALLKQLYLLNFAALSWAPADPDSTEAPAVVHE